MRAKSHDQRKGQWLINKIRFNNPKYQKDFDGIDWKKLGLPQAKYIEDSIIEHILWNMENDEFDELMGDYDK